MTSRRPRHLLAGRRVTAMLAAVTACGLLLAVGFTDLAGSSTSPSVGEPPIEDRDALPDLVLSAATARVEIAALGERVPSAQSTAFRDGVVDAAEYHQGVLAEQRCLAGRVTSAGHELGITPAIDLTEARFTVDRFAIEYAYSISINPADARRVPDDAMAQVDAIATSCARTHSLGLEQAYKLGLRSDREFVSGAVEQLEACLADAGQPTDLTVDNAISELLTALDEVREAPTAVVEPVPYDTLPSEGAEADSDDGSTSAYGVTVADCSSQFPSITQDLRPGVLDLAWGN